MKRVPSRLWSSAQKQHRRAFDLLSGTIMASSVGSTHISETWSIEPARPFCFPTSSSNGFTCANKGRVQIPATLHFHLMGDVIRDLCCFLRFFMCRMSWESLPATHLFTILSPPLPCWIPLFFFSPSPSQVEMMYDLCCQLLSHVSRKLIMTRSSLLCQHHTPFVTLFISAPWVWQVCMRERESEAGVLHSAVVCVRERARDRDCCVGVGVRSPAPLYNRTDQ